MEPTESDGASIAVGGADSELAKALERGLDEVNMAATDVDEERSFSVRVDEPDSTLIGGLTGWIWGYTSGISKVWIRTPSRGDGWGARLLASAEQEVRRQGCRRIFVSSYNSQAPDFYRRHGYEEIARVPGYWPMASKMSGSSSTWTSPTAVSASCGQGQNRGTASAVRTSYGERNRKLATNEEPP